MIFAYAPVEHWPTTVTVFTFLAIFIAWELWTRRKRG